MPWKHRIELTPEELAASDRRIARQEAAIQEFDVPPSDTGYHVEIAWPTAERQGYVLVSRIEPGGGSEPKAG